MFPAFASANTLNMSVANAKLICQHNIGNALLAKRENFLYLCLGELCFVVFFALDAPFVRSISTSLVFAVLHVFQVCSKPKMIRIHARRVIPTRAVMANVETVWDWAIMNYPRSAMCVCAVLRFIIYQHFSIATLVYISRPKPTGFGFLDVSPKADFKGDAQHMAWYKLKWLTLDFSIGNTRCGGDWGWLSTSAPAQAAWVRIRQVVANAIGVPIYKPFRLSLDKTFFGVSLVSNLGLLPTATLAVAVWDFLRGIIGVHRKFLSDAKPGTFVASPGTFHWVATGVIIAYLNEWSKPYE